MKWRRGQKTESEMGYLLYLLGAHAKRLQGCRDRRPKTIPGVFIDGDKVLIVSCEMVIMLCIHECAP